MSVIQYTDKSLILHWDPLTWLITSLCRSGEMISVLQSYTYILMLGSFRNWYWEARKKANSCIEFSQMFPLWKFTSVWSWYMFTCVFTASDGKNCVFQSSFFQLQINTSIRKKKLQNYKKVSSQKKSLTIQWQPLIVVPGTRNLQH